MTRQLVGALLMVLAVCSATTAQSLSELMQKAIYTEETLGDLDTAIRLYQQVIAGSIPGTDVRTHAERRIEAARARRRSTPPMPLATFDGHNYRHTKTGLTFDVPTEWKVMGTGPSSDNGEMVNMMSSDPLATISVWMIPDKNDADSINHKLEGSPAEKLTQRQGFRGYQFRETQRTIINGKQAMVALAEYRSDNRTMAEYMTWIYTENTHLFFFARVQADELAQLRPLVDRLVYSSIVP